MIRRLPAAAATDAPRTEVAVIGAGACGLIAALATRDAGAGVVVLERDAVPGGNTARSIAMIPAAGSTLQRAAGIDDDGALFAADILAKTKGRTDAAMARRVAEASGPAIDWLTGRHGLVLRLLTELVYPGHSRHRYHVPPTIAGAELHAMLLAAAVRAGARIATGRRVTRIYANDDGRVDAVGGGDDGGWTLGCDALVVATDGFGADPALVARHIPEMAGAVYGGHDHTRGDGLAIGAALGAATADLGAYQGHCSGVAGGLPQTWALIIDGGIQIGADGRRFADESRGYSEQAADVVRQPGGVAWAVFDEAAERNAMLLPNHRTMVETGKIVTCADADALAGMIGAAPATVAATLAEVAAGATDRFGRRFDRSLAPPYRVVPVRGALFHTQGGLVVDRDARVLRPSGEPLPNLFAGGGAARGFSGPGADGYLGGNGLLAAVVLGRLAGDAAARMGQA